MIGIENSTNNEMIKLRLGIAQESHFAQLFEVLSDGDEKSSRPVYTDFPMVPSNDKWLLGNGKYNGCAPIQPFLFDKSEYLTMIIWG